MSSRRPDTQTAGKVIPKGDSAQSCLQDTHTPVTPPRVRKFRDSVRPGVGAVRVSVGKAGDPDVASGVVHGVVTKSSLTGEDLLSPPKRSLFQQQLEELRESVYASPRKAPLGRSHEPPPWIDDRTTFGAKTMRGEDVRAILRPSKTAEELEEEAQKGHSVYVRSHNAYSVGERVDRKYDSTHFRRNSRFGIHTLHHNDGRSVGRTLQWLGDTRMVCPPRTDWKRAGDQERLAALLGHVKYTRDQRNRLLPLPSDHTFGLAGPSETCGVGEVIQCTEAGSQQARSRQQQRQQSLVHAVRHCLMKDNFHSFPSLLKAFQHYDREGKGWIDKDNLRAACQRLQLPMSDSLLDGLMACCDQDKDGHINFLEFANFLNWKDRMPISKQEQHLLTNKPESSPTAAEAEAPPLPVSKPLPRLQPLVEPADLEPMKPGSSLKTIRTLRRLQSAPEHFTTSSALIGAAHDDRTATNGRSFGIPSVRFDLPAPRIKRVSDKTNYGDVTNAADLLHPSVHTARGLHRQHFFHPRSKGEIAEIFRNIGVELSEDTFNEAWSLASSQHPDGEVCVQVFRNALKEIRVKDCSVGAADWPRKKSRPLIRVDGNTSVDQFMCSGVVLSDWQCLSCLLTSLLFYSDRNVRSIGHHFLPRFEPGG